ncbi:hypothetical protein O4328_41360 [Rhodococcus opacus]|uniref:Uncharacterized protein n=1 Tax=Rhodococcus opacus TaxID=37919 RepID=A0AAX3Y8J8_RHOOP|nr:hypothetical protein [Rhodococcus opacus]MCZ4590010.1 hypothetical protein [Rhodococcus opacus]WLF44535.1 hypothetical protein Q5707_21510 [Rhodococcus opacus]
MIHAIVAYRITWTREGFLTEFEAGMEIAQLAQQCIAGHWRGGSGEKVLVDANPFNGQTVGEFRVQ